MAPFLVGSSSALGQPSMHLSLLTSTTATLYLLAFLSPLSFLCRYAAPFPYCSDKFKFFVIFPCSLINLALALKSVWSSIRHVTGSSYLLIWFYYTFSNKVTFFVQPVHLSFPSLLHSLRMDDRSFSVITFKLWNELPTNIRSFPSVSPYKCSS